MHRFRLLRSHQDQVPRPVKPRASKWLKCLYTFHWNLLSPKTIWGNVKYYSPNCNTSNFAGCLFLEITCREARKMKFHWICHWLISGNGNYQILITAHTITHHHTHHSPHHHTPSPHPHHTISHSSNSVKVNFSENCMSTLKLLL